METTFISIHDLTEDAIILYSSESVVDILGYTPDELVSRSAWDFFPPSEVPYAKDFHRTRVEADKAAVLTYCRVKGKHGQWIGCECCFTVVYDVMVVCTSVYNRGLKSDKRATEAPLVRRVFSSSPNDPRYHMLSHISAKFTQPAKWHQHEPRAALFLNRFTRTLTIMYATGGLHDIIGIPAETMQGRSFYSCISEECHEDAVTCLENAKANDSIAYLRFWFRDPRIEDPPAASDDSDEEMTMDEGSDFSDTDVHLQEEHESSDQDAICSSNAARSTSSMEVDGEQPHESSRNSSKDSTRPEDTHDAIFGSDTVGRSSSSASSGSPKFDGESSSPSATGQIELEAVISCASDGLVVCLRKARAIIPLPTQRPIPQSRASGVFAAPWATTSIRRHASNTTRSDPPSSLDLKSDRGDDHDHPQSEKTGQGDFMKAIREQAIFAWALVGINGSLADYGIGKPLGAAIPSDGAPVWAEDSEEEERPEAIMDESLVENDRVHKTTATPLDYRPDARIFGDPGLDRKNVRRRAGSANAGSENKTSSQR